MNAIRLANAYELRKKSGDVHRKAMRDSYELLDIWTEPAGCIYAAIRSSLAFSSCLVKQVLGINKFKDLVV
jgi:hypothetical protein